MLRAMLSDEIKERRMWYAGAISGWCLFVFVVILCACK